MGQGQALDDQTAQGKAGQVEALEADMMGQGQRFADQMIDLVTTQRARGAAMAAQVEGQDGELFLQVLHHPGAGLKA